MSTENKKTETNNTIQISKNTLYGIIIAIGLLSCIVLFMTLMMVSQNNNNSGIHAVYVKNSEVNKVVEMINHSIEDLRDKSILTSVTDGTSNTTMLYNKNREAIGESESTGNKTFYLSDHGAIQFGETVGYGHDSEVLSIVEQVAKIQSENNFPVLKLVETKEELKLDDGTKIEAYAIDVRGWDNLKKVYSYVGDEFADLMIETLKASVKQLSEQEGSDVNETDTLNIRMVYQMEDEHTLYGAACYIYFGDKASNKIESDELVFNWSFGDYLELYDWSFNQRWYELDWDNLENWDDTSELETLFVEQYDSVVDMLDQFSSDMASLADTDKEDGDTPDESNAPDESDTPDESNTNDVTSQAVGN